MSTDIKNKIEQAHRKESQLSSEAIQSMHSAAKTVESNVVDGIQPDLREVRLNMSEIDEKMSLRLRQIYWAMLGLFAINMLTLILVLSR